MVNDGVGFGGRPHCRLIGSGPGRVFEGHSSWAWFTTDYFVGNRRSRRRDRINHDVGRREPRTQYVNLMKRALQLYVQLVAVGR